MISGRTLADRCRWVVDPRYPEKTAFSYAKSDDRDWVFINGDYVDAFLKCIPFLSNKRYFIIVHNSDRTFTHETMQTLRKHIYHIYAINTNVSHPRLTTIPIGFADNQLDFLSRFHPPPQDRDIQIYVNFKLVHNLAKRTECFKAFENDPRAIYKEKLSGEEYYADMCRSKFVVCPEGTGIDTHRVYEAILCGATPVVLRNSLSRLYETLPVCIVERWTDPFYVPTGIPFRYHVRDYLPS